MTHRTREQPDFFDFSTDIRQELMQEGYTGAAFAVEFEKRQAIIVQNFKTMAKETTGQVMTRAEFEKAIGL
ncbi:MAG: hypothetical protein LKF36_10330 [Lactobacillus sp.]|jgi:hypothetical protein|nr:hypothetical protein [Lactobacillus sp.]